MSTRKHQLQKVKLRPKAGFGGPEEGAMAIILSVPEGEVLMSCPLCSDPECREYPAVELLDSRGKRTGREIDHVSECEMEEISNNKD